MKSIFYTLISCILILSCKTNVDLSINKFSNEILVKIYDLKDKRDTQSLLSFFLDKNEQYRAEAALAFGSVQDTLALPKLHFLLNDEIEKVRLSAAFSIGQISHLSSLESLKTQLRQETSEQVIYELLLAYGSCVDSLGLDYLVNFKASSNLLAEGKAWGLYRAGLKKVISNEGTQQSIQFLNHPDEKVQLATANYFSRLQINNIDNYETELIKVLNKVKSTNIKMNIVRAIGKIDSENSQKALTNLLTYETNKLVLVNTLRALDLKYEFIYLEAVKNLVLVDNAQVVSTATDILIRSNKLALTDIELLISKIKSNRAREAFYGKLILLKGNSVSERIKKEYNNTSDIYYKGELIKALSNDSNQVNYIAEITFSTDVPYLKTAGITSLQIMFRNGFSTKEIMAEYFKKAIQSKDIGLIYVAAETLADTTNGLKNQFENFDFLYESKNNLTLPIDAEAMIAIQNVIDIFEGNIPSKNFSIPYNNPIDWEHVKIIPKDQKVVLTTEKGNIIWELKVEESPGTTEFFLRLVKKGFYDGLTFHRVVPNFVAQGGCPRGDGFGGTPESIRSEFGIRRYKTGSIGMASAGKDTESCQFFITHSPTPHLNGRYTIFAEVVEGMEVAQSLDLGDKIISLKIY